MSGIYKSKICTTKSPLRNYNCDNDLLCSLTGRWRAPQWGCFSTRVKLDCFFVFPFFSLHSCTPTGFPNPAEDNQPQSIMLHHRVMVGIVYSEKQKSPRGNFYDFLNDWFNSALWNVQRTGYYLRIHPATNSSTTLFLTLVSWYGLIANVKLLKPKWVNSSVASCPHWILFTQIHT